MTATAFTPCPDCGCPPIDPGYCPNCDNGGCPCGEEIDETKVHCFPLPQGDQALREIGY